MLKSLSLCFCLLAVPAVAADWTFEGGHTPIAYADNEEAQFQFACRNGDLAMAFWVRKPDAAVATAPSLSLAMNARGGSTSDGSDTTFAQDFPLIHYDGSSLLIRGPVARQWAQDAQRARDGLELAFVKSRNSGGTQFIDRQKFGAQGSSAAIGKVLSSCG